ncbi:hypothetical protein JJQ59_27225 [Cupriavidus necator]|jgi:hypothetical protein|uniref:hypothetical protein n=1 Tax=Cupriavidus necator TaxID=106590 RepID=UPI0011BE2D48|nr:hypothetical protein [Cupriavidus necator]QQX86473.1 hypothetical protein JJQ59_27225 [Cupriavidus necator]
MKISLCKRFLSAALIAVSATVAYAGERPRDNGVACARAANAYCNLPDQGNRPMPQGVPQGESA